MFLTRAILLIVVTFSIYSFMLSSWFKTMDDEFSIISNHTIQNTSQWPQLFKEGYFRDHSYYRPLVNLSYAFEYRMFGLNSFFYNLDNVIIHIASAFLVWWLVAILINIEIGFWVAFLFAVHPIQWEAVANISGRAILLSAFFSLLTMVFFVKNKMIPALFSFTLGLLCKESTAIVPGVLFFYALCFKQRPSRLLWLVPIILGYGYIRHQLGIDEFFAWRNAQEAMIGFVTFLRSVIMDVRIIFFPTDLHFDRSMPLFGSLAQVGAVLTIVVWVLVITAIVAYRKIFEPIHWLCLAWFWLTLLPISQLVTTIGVQPGVISCAEHFLYMTCIPIFMAMVDAVFKLRSLVVKWCCVGILVFFGLTTIEQNIYAQSELAMMERSLGFQPNNARLNSSVGLIHALGGRFSKAEEHFRLSVAGDPQNPRYLISLGKSICDQGRVLECLKVYESIRNPGSYAKMLNNNMKAAHKLLEGK